MGTLIGLALSWGAARLIGTVFTGTTGVPVTVLLACVGTLSVAAFVATYLPARRAARLNPMTTLGQQ